MCRFFYEAKINIKIDLMTIFPTDSEHLRHSKCGLFSVWFLCSIFDDMKMRLFKRNFSFYYFGFFMNRMKTKCFNS